MLTATDSDGIQASQLGDDPPAEGATSRSPASPTGLTVTRRRRRRARRRSRSSEIVGFQLRGRHAVAAVRATRSPRGRTAARKAHTVTVPSDRLDAHRDVHARQPAGPRRRVQLRRGRAARTLADVSGQEPHRHAQRADVDDRRQAPAARCRSTASTTSCSIADADDLDLTTGMTSRRGCGRARSATPGGPSLFKEQPTHMTYALYAATVHGPADRPGVRRRPARRARHGGACPTAAWSHLADDLRRQRPCGCT